MSRLRRVAADAGQFGRNKKKGYPKDTRTYLSRRLKKNNNKNMENVIIDTNECYLSASYHYWKGEAEKTNAARKILKRTTRIIQANSFKPTASGDDILEKIRFLLETGFGVQRSPTQVN